VIQDRAGEYDAALKVCGQWTRAEPEPPGKTLEEYEAELDQRMAEADARFLAAEAQAEKDRAERAKHYDHDRAQARLGERSARCGTLERHAHGRGTTGCRGQAPTVRAVPRLLHDR
jgi:hypothetical protein